ncbi:tRNA (adenosine(37)-N6)-threonylcarbamoyltransferase complex ATPase subunit type 1 TsaE [Candidatus Berkelbacteria bacterium]|nr:tRNA (adenosine(37)-N6)-threonylcarbamoyltransferase complex ATPase subunit type 1 TsaE [Candidatus Berkelbacteria bacterium]
MQLEYTETELPKIAKKICKQLLPGDFLALKGELAAGKTTLTREVARVFGYSGTVNSPTYVLEHRYKINSKKIKEIIHIDLYRLSEGEVSDLDWSEYRNRKDIITIIEWPEIAKKELPPNTKEILIEIIDAKKRRITLSENFSA